MDGLDMSHPPRVGNWRTYPVTLAEDGTRLCRWCKRPVAPGRRNYCDQAEQCIHEIQLRTNAGYVRRRVWDRDKGVCAQCGSDTEAKHRAAMALRTRLYRVQVKTFGDGLWRDLFNAFYGWNGLLQRYLTTSALWEADHIVPVAEGGGQCGLEGYRTLCKKCHAKETGALRKRLNQAKKAQVQEGLFA